MSDDFTHLWSVRSKQKVKEQNSSRLTEPTNGVTVTKGKRSEEDGWEGGISGKRGIMISIHNVCGGGRHGKGSLTQISSDSITSYYTSGK